MSASPKVRSPIQVATLCFGMALGGVLDEVRESDPQTEWEVRSCEEAHTHLPEFSANPPHVFIPDWPRCLSCHHNCALALHKSCPNLALVLLGADPKSANLPPQVAARLAVFLPAEPCPPDLLLGLLHLAVCVGAQGTDEALARAALRSPLLRGRLRDKWPYADDHDINQAIEDAVLSHLTDPRRYDPRRGSSVADFLYVLVQRRLANLVRGQKRRARRLLSLDETAQGTYTEPTPTASSVDLIIAAEAASEQAAVLARRLEALLRFAKEHFSATDRAVLWLMWRGKRRTVPYAAVLGASALPAAEQQRAAHQAKERVMKALKRWVRRWPASHGQGAASWLAGRK